MRRNSRSIWWLLMVTLLSLSLLASADEGVYEIVFRDEFDYEGPPDPQKWGYDVGGDGWGNGELQFYTDSGNAWADGKHLIIEARAERREGAAYTSARLVTRGLVSFCEGIIEIRARVPTGRGTWSAIWLLPEDKRYGGWLHSGEIDLMEHVGFDPGVIYASLHTLANNSVQGNPITRRYELADRGEGFHIYVLEWTEDLLIVYIDNVELFRYRRPRAADGEGWKTWPFDLPFYLLFNVAVGGSWGGAEGVDETSFPQRMAVDYVRVYQRTDRTR